MAAESRQSSDDGFTLMEVLAVLAIIGFLVTMAATRTRERLDEGDIIAALNQMNRIKTAVVDGFYRDFGCIPQEIHKVSLNVDRDRLYQNPEYATRFLCIQRDCTDAEIDEYYQTYNTDTEPDLRYVNSGPYHGYFLENNHPGCYFMAAGLSQLGTIRNSTSRQYFMYPYYLKRNSLTGRGWAGAYLEANSQFNATAMNRRDDEQYPDRLYSDADTFPEDVFLPVISTPWADDIETAAGAAEAEDDPDQAAELRKGKYYQILVYTRNATWIRPNGRAWRSGRWEQVPETAVIISRGADGLPGTEGDELTTGAEDYWMACAEMSKYSLSDEQRACFERLKITDPDDPDYVDIGDDLVLFIFGGGPVRSPLENR